MQVNVLKSSEHKEGPNRPTKQPRTITRRTYILICIGSLGGWFWTRQAAGRRGSTKPTWVCATDLFQHQASLRFFVMEGSSGQ